MPRYICDQCSYNSDRPSKLERHARSVHSDERPFECDTCDSKFKLLSHLNVHKNGRCKGGKGKQNPEAEPETEPEDDADEFDAYGNLIYKCGDCDFTSVDLADDKFKAASRVEKAVDKAKVKKFNTKSVNDFIYTNGDTFKCFECREKALCLRLYKACRGLEPEAIKCEFCKAKIGDLVRLIEHVKYKHIYEM